MHATVGDRLVIKSHHVGDRDREALVLEVHGPNGTAPYKVRWSDGQESLFFPSSDCSVSKARADEKEES